MDASTELRYEHQAIGKFVAGTTKKIHMSVDACGFPIEFQLTGGKVHDAKAAPQGN
ncbi:transposase [Legionella longbeachae]|nr:transposase [Legionella longbeachae]